ncbi:DUF1441 family protein [Pantoea sp. NGS-ED-1003]|uniref:DUF1441 family protein n=1 Tax=Pantoea sp. NGS-ED-1003 TaxID=1526743 RepID=UPI0005351CAC|nr:DUF1441 family protein [Pantoea sp. NGS-ED-1003]
MSDISRIGDAYNWSVAKIAEAFGIDRKTVRKKIMNAQVASAGNIRGNPVYALKDIGPVLFAPDEAATPETLHDPSRMDPKSRKDWFQSENERVKLEAALSQLVPANEVHREMAMMAKSVLQVLDTWPDRLERDRGWSPHQISEAQSIVDEIREALAAEIRSADIVEENES